MAEQLSDLSYKPWMKGNFSELQLNGVDVAVVGPPKSSLAGAYFQGNCTTQTFPSPIPENFKLTMTEKISSGVAFLPPFQIVPQVNGTFYCSANIVFLITGTQPNVSLNLNLTLDNATTGEVLRSGGIFGNGTGNLIQNINISGLLRARIGDSIELNISATGSFTDALTIYGVETPYSSQFSMFKVGN
jgi:hypothetical protein